jgi:hypothetical protein
MGLPFSARSSVSVSILTGAFPTARSRAFAFPAMGSCLRGDLARLASQRVKLLQKRGEGSFGAS